MKDSHQCQQQGWHTQPNQLKIKIGGGTLQSVLYSSSPHINSSVHWHVPVKVTKGASSSILSQTVESFHKVLDEQDASYFCYSIKKARYKLQTITTIAETAINDFILARAFVRKGDDPKPIGGKSIAKRQDPYPLEESKPIGRILQSHLVSSNTVCRSFHSEQVSRSNNNLPIIKQTKKPSQDSTLF